MSKNPSISITHYPLQDGVGPQQSPTGNGQASGEGHRGQVPRYEQEQCVTMWAEAF